MTGLKKIRRKLLIRNLLVLFLFATTVGTIVVSIYLNKRLKESFSEIHESKAQHDTISKNLEHKLDSLEKASSQGNKIIEAFKLKFGPNKVQSLIDSIGNKKNK